MASSIVNGDAIVEILSGLPRPRLAHIAREAGVVLRGKEIGPGAIAANLRDPRRLLPLLTRDELRSVCRMRGLDHRGRDRSQLMSRLLDSLAVAAPHTAEPADAYDPYRAAGLPSVGKIAVVRHRHYLVQGVQIGEHGKHSLVRLVCIDDDAAGQSLEVAWERELGARAFDPEEQALAPERLDPPRVFAAYMHTLSWNSVTATDARLFQAPFRAGIRLFNHQLVPLRKALELPRANLFIADDVGLGKTIEAGLVLQELLLRQRIDRALIVCPASVALQWQDEMNSRFGLRFALYNRDFVGRRRQERGFAVNPWDTFPRFIVSYQTLRRPEVREALMRHLGDRAARSLLILDEAHNAAPASGERYAVDSDTTEVVRDVAKRFEHRLFLSATPHNGHSNSFAALLEILDPQRFTRGVPVRGEKQLAPVMVRRLKRDLKEIGTEQRYPDRDVIQLDLRHEAGAWSLHDRASDATVALGPGSAAELELSAMLRRYRAIARPRGRRGRALVNLQKRLLSSIEAFWRTLGVHLRHLGAAAAAESPELDPADDEYGPDEEAQVALELAEAARGAHQLGPVSEDGLALGRAMLDLAGRTRLEPSAKVLALVSWIQRNLCPGVAIGGSRGSKAERRWNDRRVIVFTEYADTKRYLRDVLRAACDGTDDGALRIMEIHGGMSDDQRAAVQGAFNGSPAEHPVRILLCTDAAREGVNLQGHCADLFHFDIPWNPGRMEQRNGRIDRTLQPAPVVRCHYFFYPQRVEDRALEVLVGKVGRIQRDLGSIGTVLAERLTAVLEDGIAEDSAETLEAAAVADAFVQTAHDELESIRRLEVHRAEIEEVAKLLNDSREVAEFDPVHLRAALDVALGMLGAGPLQPAAAPPGAWIVPALPASWDDTVDTLRPPRARDEDWWDWRRRPARPVVFDAPALMTSDVVHLHLQHPFVRRLLARFSSHGFAASDLARVTVVKNPKDSLTRVVAYGRLTLYGRGATRLHEEVIPVAARWIEGRGEVKPFAEKADRDAVSQLETLFAQPELPELEVSDDIAARLVAAAPRDFASLWPHVRAEAEAREHAARTRLAARAEEEAAALIRILEDQRAAIRKQVIAVRQTDLFAQLGDRRERDQAVRDADHMDRRIDQIGVELAEEPKAIRDSYAVMLRRLEPVGLVYLWPRTR